MWKITFISSLIFGLFIQPPKLSATNLPTYTVIQNNNDSILVIFNSLNENLNSCSIDLIRRFFNIQIIIRGNVEYEEIGNELIFKLLRDRTEDFICTLKLISNKNQNEIICQLKSPISDDIDLVILKEKVINLNNKKIDKETKKKVLDAISEAISKLEVP